jgi:hypothetical protein
MGCDPSGFLVYGIDFGADEEMDSEVLKILTDSDDPEEEEGDFEDRVYAAYASPTDPPRPTAEFPDLRDQKTGRMLDPTPEQKLIVDAFDTFWQAKRRVVQLVGIDVLLTGSDSNHGRVLYVVESELSVEWNDTADAGKHIDQFTAAGAPAVWSNDIAELCRRLKLPSESKPKWLLATRYW